MDEKLKKRAVIKFLTKEGSSPADIHRRLKDLYDDAVIEVSNVRHWVKKFKERETEIVDKQRSARPSTSVTDENRHRIDELIRADRITIIGDAVHVSYTKQHMQ